MRRADKQRPAGKRASTPEEWVDEALDVLASSGRRAGGARTAVIRRIAAEGGCLEAEALAAKLRAEGNGVGTASVYRALGLLSDLGLLKKVALPDAPARFELVLPGGEHHHHLVCDRCGKTRAFSDDAVERAIAAASSRSDFEITGHEITLYGRCESCRR